MLQSLKNAVKPFLLFGFQWSSLGLAQKVAEHIARAEEIRSNFQETDGGLHTLRISGKQASTGTVPPAGKCQLIVSTPVLQLNCPQLFLGNPPVPVLRRAVGDRLHAKTIELVGMLSDPCSYCLGQRSLAFNLFPASCHGVSTCVSRTVASTVID